MSKFDFEEQIVKCWSVVDDLKDLDEGLFEGWLKFDQKDVSKHILGIANSYDIKFHKLFDLFDSVHMNMVRENKRLLNENLDMANKVQMIEEECAALREQLQESDPDTHGYGIAAIKPNKKDKK